MSPKTSPYSIVLVDDHAGIRQQVRTALAGVAGVSVDGEADTAPKAIELIARLHPHAVVLDLHLPGGSGLHVLRTIKGLSRPPLVIILSNMSLPEYWRACRRAGADFVLDKSHDFPRVRAIVADASRARAEQQSEDSYERSGHVPTTVSSKSDRESLHTEG